MTTQNFNASWQFALNIDVDASAPDFDDSAWRTLDLPHDWSIEFPFDKSLDGATGYLPGGVGWYRKRFITHHDKDQRVFILFDGIYNNSEVWCNGRRIGENPYGYSPFWFDLTPYLNDKGEQVIAVKVDRTRYVDSRWYTGSGIYRNVKLITKPALHVPIWGAFVTTPEVGEDSAEIQIAIDLKNDDAVAREGSVFCEIVDPTGGVVESAETDISLAADETTTITQSFTIADPIRWQLDDPQLYHAIIYLNDGTNTTKQSVTPFGLRTFRFDSNDGFFFNGINTLIKGVCLHHDAGIVGAAVPDGVWRRRLAALRELGCNAIRIAHNPSSEAFLNLCDEMGFLVQAEIFDEWHNPKDKRLNNIDRHDDYLSRGYAEHFHDWAESDLKRTMQRDRNHPCIFQWSIGNEIEWTFPHYRQAVGYFDADTTGNYFFTPPPLTYDQIRERLANLPEKQPTLTETAHQLAQWTREMDTTRPVVGNCILPSVSLVSGYTDALDIVGYSYRQVVYDVSHAAFPDKIIMGTENLGQWHEWMHVVDRPFISGIFIWTGIHYMGECHDKWPQRGLETGLLDFAGFERPSGLLYKTLWRDDPQIHMTTQLVEQSPYQLGAQGNVVEREPGAWRERVWFWHEVNQHWNYDAGEQVVVELFSNCDEVELFLNDESLGRQRLAAQEDRIFKWAVPFAAGTLTARGWHNSGEQATTQMQTAGEPVGVTLVRDDRGAPTDIAHFVAQLVDADGNPVKHVEREITFNVPDDCRILGVDNGHYQSVQPYQTNRVTTSQGRALLIAQGKQGGIKAAVTITPTFKAQLSK